MPATTRLPPLASPAQGPPRQPAARAQAAETLAPPTSWPPPHAAARAHHALSLIHISEPTRLALI
eukprot:10601523-Alexandrium_andersonii.AAC.1